MYPFDNDMVDKTEHSNEMVVNTIDVDAPAEDVFELLATESGRRAWLEPDPERTLVVESEAPPRDGESGRISWWGWSGEDSPRQVEVWVQAIPEGSRVIAIESTPALDVTMFTATGAATPGMPGVELPGAVTRTPTMRLSMLARACARV